MKIHISAGKPERRQVNWICSGDIPLLYKFSEFFMFKPAQHWVEKAQNCLTGAYFLRPQYSAHYWIKLKWWKRGICVCPSPSLSSSSVISCHGRFFMPRKDLAGSSRPTPVALQPSLLLSWVSAISHCGLFLFPDCSECTLDLMSHQPRALLGSAADLGKIELDIKRQSWTIRIQARVQGQRVEGEGGMHWVFDHL